MGCWKAKLYIVINNVTRILEYLIKLLAKGELVINIIFVFLNKGFKRMTIIT